MCLFHWVMTFWKNFIGGCPTSTLWTAAQCNLQLQCCVYQQTHPRQDRVQSAKVNAQTQTGIGRSDSERTQHINVLELKAAFSGPKVLSKESIPQGVMHENVQLNGSSPCEQRRWYPFSLPLSTHIGTLAMVPERKIMISAQHVLGKLNTIFDSESRVFNDSSEWKIDPRTIFPFLRGSEIDLFASRLSAQLPQYVSWRSHSEAVHADVLTMDWAPFKGCTFPPFNLIPAVLNKVSQD